MGYWVGLENHMKTLLKTQSHNAFYDIFQHYNMVLIFYLSTLYIYNIYYHLSLASLEAIIMFDNIFPKLRNLVIL